MPSNSASNPTLPKENDLPVRQNGIWDNGKFVPITRDNHIFGGPPVGESQFDQTQSQPAASIANSSIPGGLNQNIAPNSGINMFSSNTTANKAASSTFAGNTAAQSPAGQPRQQMAFIAPGQYFSEQARLNILSIAGNYVEVEAMEPVYIGNSMTPSHYLSANHRIPLTNIPKVLEAQVQSVFQSIAGQTFQSQSPNFQNFMANQGFPHAPQMHFQPVAHPQMVRPAQTFQAPVNAQMAAAVAPPAVAAPAATVPAAMAPAAVKIDAPRAAPSVAPSSDGNSRSAKRY